METINTKRLNIKISADLLTKIKDDILKNRVTLPYIYEVDLPGDSNFIIRYIFDNKDGQNVTMTTEQLLKNEVKCSEYEEYSYFDTEFKDIIIQNIKDGKITTPYILELRPNKNGVRKEITFKKNSDGTITMITKTLKSSKIKYSLNRAAFTRIMNRKQNFKKFGAATGDQTGITMVSDEDIYIETPDGKPLFKPDKPVIKKEEKRGRDAGTLSFADMFKNPYKPKKKTVDENENKSDKFVFKKRSRNNSIIIKNLPPRMTEDEDMEADIRTLFKKFGRIKSIKVLEYEYDTKAFVNYYLESEAKKAVENMNEYRYKSMIIDVQISENKKR